jgi:hypothetical protein
MAMMCFANRQGADRHSASSANNSNAFLAFVVLTTMLLMVTACGGGKTSSMEIVENLPPVANGSCFGTPVNPAALTGDLSTLVSDPDSPVLSFALETDGVKGTVSIDPTGAFTYTPLPNARGFDSFTYSVDDLAGGVATATVTVLIGSTRIMPLGDSITLGTETPNPPDDQKVGYRKPLYDALVAQDFSVDFVGTLNQGYGIPNFDFDHEGHGGWRDDEIAFGKAGEPSPNGVFEWLEANPADIVVLHIGTNALDPSPDDVADILDEIDRWEASAGGNHVTVVLARIIDQDPFGGTVTDFNNNVVTMALDRVNNPLNPAYPDDIIIVNQQSALVYPDDMSDGQHPNDTGYAKMAGVWLSALTALVPKCP